MRLIEPCKRQNFNWQQRILIDTADSKLPTFRHRRFSFVRYFQIKNIFFYFIKHFETFCNLCNRNGRKFTNHWLFNDFLSTAQMSRLHSTATFVWKNELYFRRESRFRNRTIHHLKIRTLRNDYIRKRACLRSVKAHHLPNYLSHIQHDDSKIATIEGGIAQYCRFESEITMHRRRTVRAKFAIRRWRERRPRLPVCEREPETGPQIYITRIH